MLDEPTSGLSETEAECFGREVMKLKGRGVSVILVEHNVRFVMEHSTRVVALNFGTVLAEGTPEEIQRNPEVQAAYLG
jgi:branched-chain amino acid transport system ATP-binding protein